MEKFEPQCNILENIDKNTCKIQCTVCGAIMNRTYNQASIFKHSKFCSTVFHTIIRQKYSGKIDRLFSSKFNSIKAKTIEQDGILFDDFPQFYNEEFENFIEAVKIYG